MAQLSPSILSKKCLRGNDHKTIRPLGRTPTTCRGPWARTRKETLCGIVDKPWGKHPGHPDPLIRPSLCVGA
jgi:hypothetical protein